MGRGSPICERVRKKIVEYFKNNVPQHQNHICKSHHLQCITSSKDSEKLEKSLCVRDKAKDLCWMPVVFGPSDDTASLIGMILSLTLLNGPRNTSRKPLSVNTIRRAICRCQLKLDHCKKEAICEHGQKRRRVLWAKAHLNRLFQVEKCSRVR